MPNFLTFLRILLIPVLVVIWFVPIQGKNVLAMSIFIIASLTDWLDGYLARKMQQTSKFGAFLDPVADKLIVAVVLVLLVQAYPTAWLAIAAVVIIGREIAISALREWMAEIGQRQHLAVSHLGKYKTFAQMTALVLLLYGQPLGAIPIFYIGLVLLYVAVILTLWSMLIYLRAAWSNLRQA